MIKINKIIWISVFLLILVGCFFLSGCIVQKTIESQETGKNEKEITIVTKILDGDTIIIQGGYTVRLLGIDTPEKGEPYYKEAKEYLEERILMKTITLEKDKEEKDTYGRLLRWVWLNDSLINLEQIKNGYAIARLTNCDKYREEIITAENEAIKERRGIWSKLDKSSEKNKSAGQEKILPSSNEFNLCIELGCPEGTRYVASKNSNKFHECSCKFAKKIKKDNILCFPTKEEALKRGYLPCGSCKP